MSQHRKLNLVQQCTEPTRRKTNQIQDLIPEKGIALRHLRLNLSLEANVQQWGKSRARSWRSSAPCASSRPQTLPRQKYMLLPSTFTALAPRSRTITSSTGSKSPPPPRDSLCHLLFFPTLLPVLENILLHMHFLDCAAMYLLFAVPKPNTSL